MSAPAWHDRRDRTLAAVDNQFAETVEIHFLKGGVVDPGRAGTTITAVLRTGDSKVSNLRGGTSRNWKSRVAASGGRLSIDRAIYSGPVPVKGDKVRAMDRPGKPWFEVLEVDDRSHTRLVLVLGDAA